MGGEDVGLEAFSREVMQKLMQTEEFQQLWIDLARRNQTLRERVEVAEQPNGITKCLENDFNVPKVHFHCSHNKQKKTAQYSLHLMEKLIDDVLQQFVQTIRLAVDTFAGGTQMARFEAQLLPTKVQSHDPTSLYMAHLRLGLFCASERFHAERFGLAARQIANLLRTFTQRVSSIYSVERCSFLADSLFRLLSQFNERIQWHRRQCQNIKYGEKFGAAIQSFGAFVCRKLKEMLTAKQLRVDRPVATLRRGFSLNWPLPAAAFPIMVNANTVHQIQRRQRGFLLSAELDYDRNRIALSTHSSKKTSGRTKKQKKNARNDPSENRGKLGMDLLRSAGPVEIAALREVCKLTLEYIDGMTAAKRD